MERLHEHTSIESMGSWQRTHTTNELNEDVVGEQVCLMGWVQRKREVASATFVLLRDSYGVVQLTFTPENTALFMLCSALHNEYVIAVKGVVVARPKGMQNDAMQTGAVEIAVQECKILNTAVQPPFLVEDRTDASEELRLTYRFLDLRRPSVKNTLVLRHNIAQAVRSYFNSQGFLEIETPFLTRATPEGARDFLVPSRIHSGKMYALPQSPQQFKQLFMMSGIDRYYQIVRCFRDEDLRADRQPEFTQVDVEVSFATEEVIQTLAEGMIVAIMRDVMGMEVCLPFPRMSYKEAMERYGVDKPDTRFAMELYDITDICTANVSIFDGAESVKAFVVPAVSSRKELSDFTEFVRRYGAEALGYIKYTEEGWHSPLLKYMESVMEQVQQRLCIQYNSTVFLIAGDVDTVNAALGALRVHVARHYNLIPEGMFNFLWVTEFPLFEQEKETGRWVACHHPFTAVHEDDAATMEVDKRNARARAYDLVLNGTEIGGGSIRNHTVQMQEKMFRCIGFSEEMAQKQFGYFLEALRYGTPPHGGIAFGFDRIVALLAGKESIRDVIPFPKTQKATCLLTNAPSEVSKEQLDEIHIAIQNV